MNKTVKKIIRVALLILALVNIVLAHLGLSPIDLDSATLTQFINDGFVIIMALWNTWKNCSVTKPHLQADEIAEAIRDGAEVYIEYKYGAESDYGFEPDEYDDDDDDGEYEEAEEDEAEEDE